MKTLNPLWAKYVVTDCGVCGGVFWASSLEVAKLVVRAHGGRIQRLIP